MAISASRYTVVTALKDVCMSKDVYGPLAGELFRNIVQSIGVKSCFVGTGKNASVFLWPVSVHKKCAAMAVEIWLGLFFLRPIRQREHKMALTWLHACDSETSHSESAPPTRAPLARGDLELCAQWLLTVETVHMVDKSEPTVKASVSAGVETLISSLTCFTVPFFGSKFVIGFSATTVAYNTAKCQGRFLWSYSAELLLLFKKKAMKKNRVFHTNSQIQSPRNVFFAFQNILPLGVKNLHNTSGDLSLWASLKGHTKA